MNAQEIDEDTLDSEALQAQIDLSMSFAQGLVESWMVPHKFPTNSRKKDLEKELTDYMRRPPRLGVGASVPEGQQSTSREIARLKGKLAGSKRAREEEDAAAAKQAASDEEGESRASAIKKKARPDPFDFVHGKKKKKQKLAESLPAAPVFPSPATNHFNDDSSGEVEDMVLGVTQFPKSNSIITATSTPVKSKKKKQKALKEGSPNDPNVHTTQPHASSSPLADTSVLSCDALHTPKSKSGKSVTGAESIDCAAFPAGATTPWSSNIHPKSLPPALANVQLLNLSGPPSDPESDADHASATTTSPKKKRKRKKKKRHNTLLDTTSPIQTTALP